MFIAIRLRFRVYTTVYIMKTVSFFCGREKSLWETFFRENQSNFRAHDQLIVVPFELWISTIRFNSFEMEWIMYFWWIVQTFQILVNTGHYAGRLRGATICEPYSGELHVPWMVLRFFLLASVSFHGLFLFISRSNREQIFLGNLFWIEKETMREHSSRLIKVIKKTIFSFRYNGQIFRSTL